MSQRNAILTRIGISLALGLLLAWALSEASFLILRTKAITRRTVLSW